MRSKGVTRDDGPRDARLNDRSCNGWVPSRGDVLSLESTPLNVHLIRLDPYDPNLGVLVPIVAKRITEFAREYHQELDPLMVTRNVMVPLWNQDPFTLVLAMVNTEGTVVGHAVGGIQSDGGRATLVISQTQADGAVGDAVIRSLDHAREWVDSTVNPLLVSRGLHPVDKMSLVTGKNEKSFERDYGLKLERRVLSMPLHSGEKGSDA